MRQHQLIRLRAPQWQHKDAKQVWQHVIVKASKTDCTQHDSPSLVAARQI
jgi:hypothetical protein